MQSLGMFKHAVLKTMFPKIEVPPYFLHGHSFPSAIDARLRNTCSDLNDDLF